MPTVTWEGDKYQNFVFPILTHSYMLTQQVARYLLKTARELKEKKGHVLSLSKNPTIEYLKGLSLLLDLLNQ